MNNPKPMSIAVIIPAYNEAATIAAVVNNATQLGHVVVVNDGSVDNTESLARAAGATVLTLTGNQGYEGALSAGVKYAIDNGFAFALTMDADGQHQLESAKALISALQDSDVAVGIRHKKQRVTEFVAGWVGALLWGISDPFSGLKLYRLASCKALAPFDSRRLVGAEMMVRAKRHRLKLVAIPIQTAERADAPRFGSLLRANYRLGRATLLLVGISLGILR
jgi:glycosyltransferase involved in cell wall biosynthesis